MARTRYEYGTTPRKLEPDIRKKQVQKEKIKIVKDVQRQKVQISDEQKRKQIKLTFVVIGIFILLLTISYRNSQINEKFNQGQKLKKELSTTQKENEQLKVNIESALNLNTIEKQAKERLGMQKLTNKQTVYVTLPKKDYVEPASEEVKLEEEKNWFESFLGGIFN